MVDIKDSKYWAEGFRYYEKVRVVNDINHFGCELKALDAMKSFHLWLTWTTPSHEHKALDAMNNLGLSMTWKIRVVNLGM